MSGCASTDSGEPPGTIQAQQESPSDTTNKVAVADNGEKLICYRQKEVGTHFSKKICNTRRQIEEERRVARDLLDRSRSHDATQITTEQ